MIIKNYCGKEPLIAHFQGMSYYSYPEIIESLKTKNNLGGIPKNIQIVTVATKNYNAIYNCNKTSNETSGVLRNLDEITFGDDNIESNIHEYLKIIKSSCNCQPTDNTGKEAILLSQLINNSIPYINRAAEHKGNWEGIMKIPYILKGLENVTSEYVLILDSLDVLIIKDLSDIIDRFKEYGKKVLFGASKNNYPNLLIDKIYGRDNMGEFRYLNAGTCFGKTEDVKEFYMKSKQKLESLGSQNLFESEQFVIRHAFADNTEDVGFDYNCSIFQTFGGTIRTVEDEDTIIIS